MLSWSRIYSCADELVACSAPLFSRFCWFCFWTFFHLADAGTTLEALSHTAEMCSLDGRWCRHPKYVFHVRQDPGSAQRFDRLPHPTRFNGLLLTPVTLAGRHREPLRPRARWRIETHVVTTPCAAVCVCIGVSVFLCESVVTISQWVTTLGRVRRSSAGCDRVYRSWQAFQ